MGIGNLLLSDDGLGVHAVKALAERNFPEDVQVLDVGTAFLDALPFLETAERIIVIDAIRADGEPGKIYCLTIEQRAPRSMHGLHDFDIFNMLAMANNHCSVEVLVLGIEPERLAWGLELSPRVARALPALLDTVCEQLGN
jgi:hydrogenase maturation protease